jgi:predicted small lipoprotein YifL
MRPALLRTATLLLLLAAAGCGQKGALYLPDKTRTTVPAADGTAPAAAPAPAPATPSGSSGS